MNLIITNKKTSGQMSKLGFKEHDYLQNIFEHNIHITSYECRNSKKSIITIFQVLPSAAMSITPVASL